MWNHPPVGVLIIAGGILLWGDEPFGWRFSSAVFGAIGILLVYLMGLAITRDRRIALLAAGLVLGYTLAWIEIFRKAGYSISAALLMLFPGVNAIVFAWFAFWPWPVRRQARILRRMKREVHRADERTDRHVDAA